MIIIVGFHDKSIKFFKTLHGQFSDYDEILYRMWFQLEKSKF